MTIEQIIQLTQAGFTAEQITALAPLINGGQPQPQPQAQPQPQTKTQQDAILEQLAALTSAIQSGNINNHNNPADKITSADVAAAIINPAPKKEV